MFTIIIRLFLMFLSVLFLILVLEEIHISERFGFERQFNHEDWMVGLIERKSVCSNKTVLTFKKVGRLGNQLSSYANMLVSQRLFNLNSYFPSKAVLENVQAFFENVTMPVLTENKAGACRVEWLRLPKFSVFAVENMRCGDLCYPALPSPHINKSNMGLISLTGHTGPRFEMLQLHRSWLFTNHFRLNSTLRSAAEAVMARYKKRSSCVIGVHVRRTDYKKLLGGKYPHKPEFYRVAADLLRSRWGGECEVLVLSDDMAWCRANIRIPAAHFIGSSQPHLDLACLSLASHNVIDYGTFGVWGGYLSGGDVVLPASATVKYSKFAKLLNWTVLEGF